MMTEAPELSMARSPTVNLLAPRERIRGLVAARLFGEAAVPARIGPFELIRELGAGGMGVVYAAHDPRLDRAVALKVLARASESVEAGRRLLREAQAMARLKHPNVVPVYEVGTHGGQVFIAMELVDGGTLDQWMKRGPRPWQEALEILVPAGRGLAAAHAAGLVHRDFKPANVLLDAEGRARVTDFGLARGGADAGAGAPLDQAEVTEELRGSLVDTPLTRTGALLGTPAYMSPEQFAGATATPRSDIFAFCVVAWEVIYGRRPFEGRTLPELVASIEYGRITPPPREIRAPAWLRRLLVRGLSLRPCDRFASMNELLAALEDRGRAGAWRVAGGRGALAAGAGASLAAGLVALMMGSDPASSASAAAPVEQGAAAGEARGTAPFGVKIASLLAVARHFSAVERAETASPVSCDAAGCAVSRGDFDAHFASALALALKHRIVPAQQEGAPQGLRFYGLREGHFLKRLGFRNGDTFVEIEGVRLTTVASWDAAVEAARGDDEVVVTYERKGEALQRALRIVAEGS